MANEASGQSQTTDPKPGDKYHFDNGGRRIYGPATVIYDYASGMGKFEIVLFDQNEWVEKDDQGNLTIHCRSGARMVPSPGFHAVVRIGDVLLS